MTRDDIITLGKQAGFTDGDFASFTDLIVHFGMLVAAHERAACIQIVQGYDEYSPRYGNHLASCIADIRARGNNA